MVNKSLSSILMGTAIGLTSLASVTSIKAEEQESTNAKQPLINSFYADAGYFSRYLGKFGFTISKGPVAQSDIGFNVGPIAYNFWNNYDTKIGKVNEIDNSISYTYSTKNLDIAGQFIYFTFPNTKLEDAYQLGIAVKTKNLPINAKLDFIQSSGEISHEGREILLQVDKSFKLSEKVSLSLQGRVAYNEHYFVGENGFSHAAGELDLNVDLRKGFSLTASARAQKAIDGMHSTFVDHALVYGFNLNKKF